MNARHDPMDWRASKPGHDAPMAYEPRSLIDSWPFLIIGLTFAITILCASAWGYL